MGYDGGPILRYCGSVPRPGPKSPFAPRIGFNYRVDNKTVVRAGYGVFFDSYEGREIDDSADIYPYSIRLSLNPGPVQRPILKLGNDLFPLTELWGPSRSRRCRSSQSSSRKTRSIHTSRPGRSL